MKSRLERLAQMRGPPLSDCRLVHPLRVGVPVNLLTTRFSYNSRTAHSGVNFQGNVMKNLGLALILLFASNTSYADKWTGPLNIVDIYTWNFDYINIRVSPYYNPDGCSDGQGYKISGDSAYVGRMFSQILAAYVSGKPMSFRISGCSSDKPEILAISFTQARS